MMRSGSAGGVPAVAGAVVLQFMLEVTLGRVFAAPDVLLLVLVYLSINHGDRWSIEGAFWAGLALDMLLHQPPGASSLGLLAGMVVATLVLEAMPRESRGAYLLAGGAGSVACDAVFFAAASRPFILSLDSDMLIILPRAVLTLAAGSAAAAAGILAGMVRREAAE
ncbi:rod shape-determining protein MreD [Candidatus Fermentibacteria bacterium]|nr:rod shape-determining protein MreD [Candidatus Fermentibacteria bacterium]